MAKRKADNQLDMFAPKAPPVVAAPAIDARPESVPPSAVLDDGVWRWAVFGEGRRYRYVLGRWWAPGPRCLFALTNPSTADAGAEDPTSRRVIGFAKAFGCGSVEVVNPFALCATDPAELLAALARGEDCVGFANDTHISAAATRAQRCIVGWGPKVPKARAGDVLAILAARLPVECLRTTKDGSPEHVLYLPGSLRPIPYATGPDDGAVTMPARRAPWER